MGMGLRSHDYSYMPGPDDIYVSHSQIKRFRLRTGHSISGQVGPPKDNERLCLARVETVNGSSPDQSRDVVNFVNLTLYPEEMIKIETRDKEFSTIIDMVAPIGKGQRGLISPTQTGKTVLLQKMAMQLR